MIDKIKYSFLLDSGNGVYKDFETGFTKHSIDEVSEIKLHHDIDKNTPVYIALKSEKFKKGDFFSADRKYTFSTCILEEGITFACSVNSTGWAKEDDMRLGITWDEIEKVEFSKINVDEENNKPNAYFIKDDPSLEFVTNNYVNVLKIYFQNEHYYMCIPYFYFANKTKSIGLGINKIIQILASEKNNKEIENNSILEELKIANQQRDYNRFLNIMDSKNFWGQNIEYTAYGISNLIKVGRTKDAELELRKLERFIDSSDENKEKYSNAYHLCKAELDEYNNKFYDAAENYYLAKQTSESSELFNTLNDEDNFEVGMSNNYQSFVKEYSQLPYAQKKVITITNTNTLFKTDNLTLLQLNSLPIDLKFPITHPKKDETYVCHPYNQKLYLPIEEYDTELLNDRINEYCYLMQCLGATSIDIRNTKGNVLNEVSKDNLDVDLEARNAINLGGKAKYKKESGKTDKSSSKFTFKREQHFNPTQKPFIPNDLIWFPHEASWQRLAKQRLNGGILQHIESVSSSQNKILNMNEMDEIKADLTLAIAKINGRRKVTSEVNIRMNEDVEWTIIVNFKPIEEFLNQTSSNYTNISETIEVLPTENNLFTDEEEQFMEEVRFMLEDDNQIDAKEDMMLERFRSKLNITEQRAEELKSIVISSVVDIQLTNEEEEYLEDFALFIKDGEIQEKERRMLNRVAGLLGISDERIREIEEYFVKK